MFDYNRGYAPDIEASGVMDIFRMPKFSYWFYRSQAEDGPVCFMAHYNLPTSGNTIRVFSNADTVRLFRNDTLMATQGPDNDINCANLRHPPFTFTLAEYVPGTLKAAGLRKGAEFGSHTVTTPGPPSAIRLSADFSNKPLRADGADVIFIYATLVDSLGYPVMTADSTVEFSVRGNAALIGDNPAKAVAGIATILLKAGTNPGKVMVKAVSGTIAEAEIMTETKQ
jgi:beta-galactosidase